MNTDNETRPDPAALDPHIYHRVVGPALQAAAETAAQRGHKYLFDDMPVMLALVDMVTRLADLYREHYPDNVGDGNDLLDRAATAACVMVFQEAELPPETIGQLLAALETAYSQIHGQSLIDGGSRYIAMAWAHVDDDQREHARQCLIQATEQIVAAIEIWQREAAH